MSYCIASYVKGIGNLQLALTKTLAYHNLYHHMAVHNDIDESCLMNMEYYCPYKAN